MGTNNTLKTVIKQYPFNADGQTKLSLEARGKNWPVVYILQGGKEAYIGETLDATKRMGQHLTNPERKTIKDEYVLFNETFNKSAILDIESMLIEHMYADGLFRLQNQNSGQSKSHDYYQRGYYRGIFGDIWQSLLKRKLAHKNLIDVENSRIFKYSPFKQLTDEQYQLEQNVIKDITDALNKSERTTVVIEGGAGTGKSILGIALAKFLAESVSAKTNFSHDEEVDEDNLAEYYDKIQQILISYPELSIAYAAPMTEFRNTLKDVFRDIPCLKKVDVVSPVDLTKKEGGYDVVIVDEAHHLGSYSKATSHSSFKLADARLGFTDYLHTNQLDWIKKQAKQAMVLFYDRKQSTSAADVPESDFLAVLNDPKTKKYSLDNQIRLKAGKEYIDFWDDLLHNRAGASSPKIEPLSCTCVIKIIVFGRFSCEI